MCPRKRTINKHLPRRVYFKHGAYYYLDKNNKWHRLAKTLHEAMIAWSRIIERPHNLIYMNQIFDRYMLEIAPKKAKSSYKNNLYQIKPLKKTFGRCRPEDITPAFIYKYLDSRGQKAPVAANREKALLSHIFSTAVRWGLVDKNPCNNVKSLSTQSRDRYINDDEFIAVRNLASPFFQCLMDFAYNTALRRGDILSIRLSNIDEIGINVPINKTKQKIIIEWTSKLKLIVSKIKSLPRSTRSLYLFCNQKGQPYTVDGISTMWQRLIKKALEVKAINQRFTFHDIRRKSATDAERKFGREYARQLLGHKSQKTTHIYISGPQYVKPLE